VSSWVFTDMQSVHIRMNSSMSPPLKILDPPMIFVVRTVGNTGWH